MPKITYDEVINRLGFFRNKANLSLRETSMQLGYNPQFMKTIENKNIELKVRTLLEFCDLINITPSEFFYTGKAFSPLDKEGTEVFINLSEENKQTILDLMKKIK